MRKGQHSFQRRRKDHEKSADGGDASGRPDRGDILRIMHPSHVPLVAKPRPPRYRGGKQGATRSTPRDHLYGWKGMVDFLVQALKKLNGFQDFHSLHIGWESTPLPYGSNPGKALKYCVHPQSIQMKMVQPEKGTADEETPNFKCLP